MGAHPEVLTRGARPGVLMQGCPSWVSIHGFPSRMPIPGRSAQGAHPRVPTQRCPSREPHPAHPPRDTRLQAPAQGCPVTWVPTRGHPRRDARGCRRGPGAGGGRREEPGSATSPRGRSHAGSVAGQEPPAARSSQSRRERSCRRCRRGSCATLGAGAPCARASDSGNTLRCPGKGGPGPPGVT